MISKQEWKSIRGSKPMPDHVMLSINGDPARTLTVTWRASADVTAGYALCREIGTKTWQRADAETGLFETDVDDSRCFWAHMDDLKPETRYEYTCGDDAHRSEVFTFLTAPENPERFQFVMLADVQTGAPTPPPDYSLLGELVRDILKKHPDIAFIMTAGDNTNCGQTDLQWTGFFEGLKGIIESVPLMLCMGNHDDMGFEDYMLGTGKYYSEKATYFSNQFKGSYPLNGPEEWETTNYYFNYGNTRFYVLGTSGFADVNEWLLEEDEGCDKTWKFGVHHFPLCYAGCNLECEETYFLMEGFERLDLVFSGHEHCFSRSFPRRGVNLGDRPSEGTIHYNCGSGHRNPPGTRSMEKFWNAAVHHHEEDVSMFAVAEIDGKKLTLTSYIEDGRVADQCTVDKESDVIYPRALAPVYNRTRLKYKGADLGLCASGTPCHEWDGNWYIPAAVLIRYIGGSAVAQPGKVTLSVYGRTATFTENSDRAQTDRGERTLLDTVRRGDRGQLYVPVDDVCKYFKMHWSYYPRNNLISIESPTEEKPIPEQP